MWVLIVTDTSKGRIGSRPILSIKLAVTIGTMLAFDDVFDGDTVWIVMDILTDSFFDGNSDFTCQETLILR